MTRNPPILLPLDGSVQAAKSLGCAAFLARGWNARLHVLSANPEELPARKELSRLHVPEAYWSLIELHRVPRYSVDEILAAVHRHRVGLLVLGAQPSADPWSGPESGESALEHAVGRVAESVLENSSVPVLFIPPGYRESLPWRRVLVAVSCRTESERALTFGIELSKTFDLDLLVVHVASGAEGLVERSHYSDARHHEFPAQLDELVERRLPRAECRQRLKRIALGRGDVVTELSKLIQAESPSVLVGGWHGHLSPGRAAALKRLVLSVPTPIALVRAEDAPRFRLKVGESFEDPPPPGTEHNPVPRDTR